MNTQKLDKITSWMTVYGMGLILVALTVLFLFGIAVFYQDLEAVCVAPAA